MREVLEDCILVRPMIFNEKMPVQIATLAGTLTMSGQEPNVLQLDPSGANRTVLLPPEARGLRYTIFNNSIGGFVLTVKEDSNTTTIGVVNPGSSVSFQCDGTTWRKLGGRSVSDALKTATVDSTAGPLTVTAAMIIAGILVRDPNGASRADTWSTAALLVAALPGVSVGDTLQFTVINNADAAETITTTAGAGMTFGATQRTHTIAQNLAQTYTIRFTNVTASSEAYVVYEN